MCSGLSRGLTKEQFCSTVPYSGHFKKEALWAIFLRDPGLSSSNALVAKAHDQRIIMKRPAILALVLFTLFALAQACATTDSPSLEQTTEVATTTARTIGESLAGELIIPHPSDLDSMKKAEEAVLQHMYAVIFIADSKKHHSLETVQFWQLHKWIVVPVVVINLDHINNLDTNMKKLASMGGGVVCSVFVAGEPVYEGLGFDSSMSSHQDCGGGLMYGIVNQQ